jgi:hypothetical protein
MHELLPYFSELLRLVPEKQGIGARMGVILEVLSRTVKAVRGKEELVRVLRTTP